MIKDKFKVNIDKSEFMKACSSLPTPPPFPLTPPKSSIAFVLVTL